MRRDDTIRRDPQAVIGGWDCSAERRAGTLASDVRGEWDGRRPALPIVPDDDQRAFTYTAGAEAAHDFVARRPWRPSE